MMTDKQLLALYGLKYNPFLPNVPAEALWVPPVARAFLPRLEALVRYGGFALISGEPGLGKSKLLQLAALRLERLPDVAVAVMERPQSALSDFYRELGEQYGVGLRVANRYGSFKALRGRWRTHIEASLLRPVLLIDEAQQTHADCLTELRLLGSVHFDSECLLTAVLCGDERLPDRFRSPELVSLGSRIRTRLLLQPYRPDELREFIDHSLEHAGAPQLMSESLKDALCQHAAGNLRVLTQMAADLLAAGAERKLPVLDEQLFIETFSPKPAARRRNRLVAG